MNVAVVGITRESLALARALIRDGADVTIAETHSTDPALARPRGAAFAANVGALDPHAFATVYVDGREKGDTPQACVRVGSGQHRVHFRWLQRRSPDHLVEVGAQHTADNPLRVSYDFRTGRFLSHAD